MKSRTEIEQRILKVNELLVHARQLAFDSYKMLVTDSSAKQILISENHYLKRVRKSFLNLSIIELSKVIGSKKEHHQIEKVINFFLNYHGDSDWQSDITESELTEMLLKIKGDDVKKRVEKLLEIRDQHYAHNDANPKNNIYDIKFFYEDFEYLLEIAEVIMEKIMNLLYEKGFVFEKYNGEQANAFLTEVIENRTELAIFRI